MPLWVAYYRRALPRFLTVRDLLAGRSHRPRDLRPRRRSRDRLAAGERAAGVALRSRDCAARDCSSTWARTASTCSISSSARSSSVAGFAVNTGGAYAAEDVTAAAFKFDGDVVGTGIWNFNAADKWTRMMFAGSEGELHTPIFTRRRRRRHARRRRGDVYPIRNPPHVHQPLIQTIVDELRGGPMRSTGESGARTSWVIDRCVAGYCRP